MSNLERAYQAIYKLAGASVDDHFVFTSSGVEAINHVIFSTYLDITRTTGKNHFLTSSSEIAPIILSMNRLENLGCVMHKAKNGSLKAISEELNPRTALLSLSAACGLTGSVNSDLEAISDLCKERDVFLHIDVTEVLGKSHFPFVGDAITFDGPVEGTGGLFLREWVELSPFLLGGDQQGGMRGGTFSHELLFEVAEKASQVEIDYYTTEIALLKMHFENSLKERVGAKVLFEEEDRVSHLAILEFDGVHTESLKLLLERKGIPSQAGGGHFQRLPLLLQSKGYPSYSALSFRLDQIESREKLEKMIDTIVKCVTHLRSYSI
jgi:cysteine desulfurase